MSFFAKSAACIQGTCGHYGVLYVWPSYSTLLFSQFNDNDEAMSLMANFYRPRSRGDNTFGSVCVCACVCVSPFVCGALLFEPFDL